MRRSAFLKTIRPNTGKKVNSFLKIQENYFTSQLNFPFTKITGNTDGPRCVVLASIHGDELNGIPVIHRLTNMITPEMLNGQLILIPIVNIPGFNIHSRYLPDRRDLNRLFPGNPNSTEGHRLADLVWNYFIKDADFGIDLHSASYNRWNYPHIRGDMRNAKIREIAKNFSAPMTLHSKGVKGSLRREATLRGIPFVLFEAGQINRFERDVVRIGTSGVLSALYGSGMLDEWPTDEVTQPPKSEEYFSKSQWVRADNGGLFTTAILPGDLIEANTTLGTISSIHGKIISSIESPCEGRVLGFNLHPQVIPGRALFNIGYEPRPL